MHQKHRKSLPNGRQQGGAFGAAPLGFVVFHLVRISCVFASFPEPILGRFWLFLVLFSGKGFSSILGAPNKRFFTKTSQEEVRTSFFNIWRFELPLTEIRRFEVEPRIPFWRFRFMSTMRTVWFRLSKMFRLPGFFMNQIASDDLQCLDGKPS